jgi:uncharacterized protein (DUF1697 family)
VKKVGVFLRAINLSGRRLLMTDFKRALAEAGYPDAQTVVATGNAVIVAKAADAALEARIEKGLEATLGQSTDVFVRAGAELAAIVAANPFPDMARDNPSHLVVVFLKGEPQAAAVEALRARIKGPEEVEAGPGCLYARYPDDIGHSKLTAAMIERALRLRGTARNWNTVLKVTELSREPGDDDS